MIEVSIRNEIMNRIRYAEYEHDIRVLYAVESGSRAWGFESPNSDYDVRFIYAHQKEWYLSLDLEEKKDVIEYEIVDEIDINGWDVRKALRLFKRSNPALVEWLQSPIIYIEKGSFAQKTKVLMSEFYSIEKGIYHYRGMTKANYWGYLNKDMVPLKKYFYVLRTLLSVMWLEKYREPAPIEFDKLRTLIIDNDYLNNLVDNLLEKKKRSYEKELIQPVLELNQFIEGELDRIEKYDDHPDLRTNDMSALNTLFYEVLS